MRILANESKAVKRLISKTLTALEGTPVRTRKCCFNEGETCWTGESAGIPVKFFYAGRFKNCIEIDRLAVINDAVVSNDIALHHFAVVDAGKCENLDYCQA